MRIDAHQHFWKFDPVRDAWITDDMKVIQRDFLPNDLAPILADNDVDGCVAVQADQSIKETEFLLSLAEQHDIIKAVVGWVDLQDEQVGKVIEKYAENNYLKGIRHIVQAEPAGFLLKKQFQQGITALEKHKLVYDVLIVHPQLQEAVEFVSAFPTQPFVVDHLAKPDIKSGEIDQWKQGMQQLAEHENVVCKLSGMVTEADWTNWSREELYPYIDSVVEAFGTDRLLVGSDWPVCLLAADYAEVIGIMNQYFEQFSETEKANIFGANAKRIYNL